MILSAVCGLAVLVLLVRARVTGGIRPLAGATVVAVIWGWGVAQFPYLLPTSLKIGEPRRPGPTLTTVLVVFLIAAVVVLPSLALLYVLSQRDIVERGSHRRCEPGAVLFDIDGTILVTGGAGAAAWQRAFREQHGIDADVAEHTDAGMTDPEITEIIFKEVIGREGTTAERARVVAGYLYHLHDTVREAEGYRVMPGIEQTLTGLIDDGTLCGIVTGNLEAAAHIKLSRAGLNRFFSFGGYGSDSRSRTELTKRALQRAETVSGDTVDISSAIAIGDTPRDVDAGHGAGIRVIGVATGSYSVDQLRDAGADWAVEDLGAGLPS